MIGVQDGAPLNDHADVTPLVRAWLQGDGEFGSAAAELARFFDLDAAVPTTGAIWNDVRWRERWLEDLAADLPDPGAQERVADDVAHLVRGEADVVVTGQQPGFLAGPLYTLYKIAATVALAEMRTAAGRRTVPLFWSGDDDDDLREALQPVAWDPRRKLLVRHHVQPGRSEGAGRMIGTLGAASIAAPAAAFLRALPAPHDLARDLAAIWEEAVRADWPWARLQRRAILRIFRGSGLLIVSGDDGFLHGAAASLYARLWEQREAYRAAIREAGQRLVGDGHEAPLGEASIARFLYVREAGQRRPLPADHGDTLPPAASLRPAVAARSLVQDWLFAPAGVVVGPGEMAYLTQLAAGYAQLGVPRAPLLPRLFAQLGPAGSSGFTAWALKLRADQPSTARPDLDPAAARVADAAEAVLVEVLQATAGVTRARAEKLAAQIGRRWARNVRNLLQRECGRQRDDHAAGQPAWVRPEGRRQERTLAAADAAALWGDALVAAILHAARRHWDAGLDGRWHEFLLAVPEP